MLLIDFGQIIIANAFYMKKNDVNIYYSTKEQTLYHLVFNRLREIRNKFPSSEYGELVICCDAKNYWRKEIFPQYKSKREGMRDKDKETWEMISKQKIIIENIIAENFPYRVLKIDRLEADDIIAALIKRFYNYRHMIVSSDGDHIQLQKYSDVQQYCPRKNTFLKAEMPIDQFIQEHIIEGDSSDSIMNIKMPDNTFIDGIRQKSITKVFKEQVRNAEKLSDVLTEEELKNYERNRNLVDYDCIPIDILKMVLMEYRTIEIQGNKEKIMKYFILHGYRMLFDSISDY